MKKPDYFKSMTVRVIQKAYFVLTQNLEHKKG